MRTLKINDASFQHEVGKFEGLVYKNKCSVIKILLGTGKYFKYINALHKYLFLYSFLRIRFLHITSHI